MRVVNENGKKQIEKFLLDYSSIPKGYIFLEELVMSLCGEVADDLAEGKPPVIFVPKFASLSGKHVEYTITDEGLSELVETSKES